jgi:hypothetical protein
VADETTKDDEAEKEAETEKAEDWKPDTYEEEGEGEETSTATPEAIARRVAALGEEDETERLARLEEEKLAERRKKSREGKGKKKGGLEAAASKRLAKIGTKAPPPKRAVATAVDADPLIEKTAQLSKWVKKNQKSVGWLVAAAAIGAIGFAGYTYFQHKRENDASATLAAAVADQRGRIGDPAKEDEDPDRPKDPTPIFKTADERRDSALGKYREVESKFAGTGAAYLARLSEAGLLLDKQDADGALTAYNEVLGTPLAQADNEVKGRALEGAGFAYELKASKGADADKSRDDAIKKFHELENLDVLGFKELGMYHQARVYETKGDKDRAKELLKSLHERLSKPGEGHAFPMLEQLAEDRLRALDPSALPPKMNAGHMGGGGGFGNLGAPGGKQPSEAQIREMIRRMQQQQKGGGGGGAPPP